MAGGAQPHLPGSRPAAGGSSGAGSARYPWVDTSAGRPFHLRMVREGRSDRNPTATEVVHRVRRLATQAGARLEPEPDRPTSPAGAHPWFSA